METRPDPSTDSLVEEGASVVEEGPGAAETVVVEPKKAAPKAKAVRKRKKAAPKSKRPRNAAEPVEPTPKPLTTEEVRESLGKAKDEFVGAVAEPAMKALGRWSEMARDALTGLVGGFLGSKKRED